MRTALILLFLFALALVPGSLCAAARRRARARSRRSSQTAPALAEWLDRFWLFDVFTAPLVRGDLPAAVPVADRLRAPAHRASTCASCARSRPRAPRNLARLPQHASFEGDADRRGRRPARLRAQAVPGRRPAPAGSPRRRATCARPATWSSTSRCWRCWSRSGSGSLYGYRGNVLVVEGDGLRQHGRGLRPLHARPAGRAPSRWSRSPSRSTTSRPPTSRRASGAGSPSTSRPSSRSPTRPGRPSATTPSRSTSRWRSTARRPT